jgi:hypothetical protein
MYPNLTFHCLFIPIVFYLEYCTVNIIILKT